MKVNTKSVFSIVVDGGCRRNGSYNAEAFGSYKVFVDDAEVRHQQFVLKGIETNNQAEYESLVWALRYIKSDPKRAGLSWVLFTDSDIVRRQLAGEIKTNEPILRSLRNKALELLDGLNVTISRKSGEEVKAILGH